MRLSPDGFAYALDVRGSRRLILLFVASIGIPVAVLVGLAVRALFQDRAFVQQEQSLRANQAASRAGELVGQEIDRWLDEISRARTVANFDQARLPSPLGEALNQPGVGVITLSPGAAWPLAALAFRLEQDPALSLPAGFLERLLRADSPVQLYAELVTGKWQLEEPRYRYYCETLRSAAVAKGASAAELARLDEVRLHREALTSVAQQVARDGHSPNSDYVVLQKPDGADGSKLIIQRHWFVDHFNQIVAPVADAASGVALAVHFPSGDGTWRVLPSVLETSPVALAADRRRQVIFGLIVGLLIMLSFGTYLTVRVVRRELEIARLKSEFVAAVSHEFRSPLTGIRQLSELLLRGRVTTDERRLEYYTRISAESDRLSRVVENLLSIAKLENGERAYRFERVDMCEWLKGVVDTFASSAAHRKHSLVADIAEGLPQIPIDRDAMTIAVDNLLDNATKYSPDAETVWLEAKADGPDVWIRVRDQGVGIAAADHARVFERFFRAGGHAHLNVPGSGLGLSLVHQIVSAHGGDMSLDSRPGAGTVVSIHLRGAT